MGNQGRKQSKGEQQRAEAITNEDNKVLTWGSHGFSGTLPGKASSDHTSHPQYLPFPFPCW